MSSVKKAGYLDDVFSVLDAGKHPCIIMGRFALKWMGCGVFAEEPLDLLIRDTEITEIVSELIKTNHWGEVHLKKKFTDDYLQPPPRIFKRSDDDFSIKFWTEAATHLIVDAGSNAYIEVPDCEALNSVLVEEDMHPDPDNFYHPYLLTKPDTRFLPHHPCQSPTRCPRTKIYIPTIARYITALIAQIQWLNENGYGSLIGYGPQSDVSLLVRYLFLEIPSQRKKLLPQLDDKTCTQVERILDRYKRTRKNKNSDIPTQITQIVLKEVQSAVPNRVQDESGYAVVISTVGS